MNTFAEQWQKVPQNKKKKNQTREEKHFSWTNCWDKEEKH